MMYVVMTSPLIQNFTRRDDPQVYQVADSELQQTPHSPPCLEL